MRQIKFRGWYGKKIGMMEPSFYGNINEIFAEENGIYMQYTGLKDKNGKEIYEGDILQGANGKRYEIRWGINSNGFVALTKEIHGNVYSSYHLAPKTEVIGNIYQNKELLQP